MSKAEGAARYQVGGDAVEITGAPGALRLRSVRNGVVDVRAGTRKGLLSAALRSVTSRTQRAYCYADVVHQLVTSDAVHQETVDRESVVTLAADVRGLIWDAWQSQLVVVNLLDIDAFDFGERDGLTGPRAIRYR